MPQPLLDSSASASVKTRVWRLWQWKRCSLTKRFRWLSHRAVLVSTGCKLASGSADCIKESLEMLAAQANAWMGESSTRTWPCDMMWFDMVVEFWCKSPSCKSGICSALLRLRTDFAETTSDNDVSLPEMFNSAVSYIFSLTQPNMLIFRTHNLVQNPTSDPATIWWQSFQDQVPLANSGMLQSLDWRDHKSENGFEEAMHWFQTHRDCTKSYEIIEDLHDLQHFTTLQKFWQSEDVAPHEIRNESWPLLHSSPVVCFIRSASLASDCHGLCREVTPGWFGRSRRDGHSCLNCEYR